MRLNKYILLSIIAFFSTALTASSRTRETRSEYLLKKEIGFIVGHSKSRGTIKAIEVYSRRQRRTLYHSYSHLLLHPASNLKIVTTSCALQNLGGSYNFKTKFEASGVQRGDTLFGNIVAVGGGDPILSYADLDSSARNISNSGIKYVDGNLVIDIAKFDSLQWGNGWMWDDEPASFAMFISPTCLDHNTITVNVSLDPFMHKLLVTTDPSTDFVKIACTAIPGPTDSLYVTRVMVNNTNTIYVGGTYTGDLTPSTYDFSVRHPAHYFGTVLKELLLKYGVNIRGKLVVTRDVRDPFDLRNLFTYRHSIDTVVTYTNKISDNLGAECFLREVPSEVYGEIGSAENGIADEKQYLEECGVDSTQYYIVDGSGVSHYDLITPNAIVKVLTHMLDQSTSDIFFHSLPIAGYDGSLFDRMSEDFVRGRVHAKTGSISGVSTLSGYVVVPGDTLVFSMMMQNFVGSEDSMLALQNRLCALLTQYRENPRLFAHNLRVHKIGTYGILSEAHDGRKRGDREEIGRAERIHPRVPSQKPLEKR